MKIFIRTNIERPGSEIICLEVERESLVEDVKAMIEEKAGIPSNHYVLLFAGKELNNKKALCDYNINPESTFHLLFKHFWIHVKLNKESRSKIIMIRNVNYITTVGDIKAEINLGLITDEQISPDKQILTFDNQILQDDGEAIGQHNIQNGSILHLTIRDEIPLSRAGRYQTNDDVQSRSQNVAVQTDHQDECEDPGKQVLAKERENDFNEEDFKSYINALKDECLVNNENTVCIVAKHLLEWEKLARILGLSEPKIVEIRNDYPHNYGEQKYQCIMKWINESGQAATLIALLRKVYFELEDKSLVIKIVEELSLLPQPLSAKEQSTGAQKICISYVRETATIKFAKQLKSDLIKNQYEVFCNEKSSEGSISVTEKPSEEIASYDVKIVILTEKYSKSGWCHKELTAADAQKNKLVLIKREEFDDSGVMLKDQLWVNFINDEEYDVCFAKLADALVQCKVLKSAEVGSTTSTYTDYLRACIVI